jgi:hypothetical protein
MMQTLDFVSLWRALAPADLPAPKPEFRFHDRRRWRFDYAWPLRPRGGVAVEVDGGQWQSGGGRHNTDGDREKLNVAAALGWRVLRFSPRALTEDPAGCVNLVTAALVLRGDDPVVEADPSGADLEAG